MSVSLTKAQVAASNSEGLTVMIDLPPAGTYLAATVPFAVETVADEGPGWVSMYGEFLDAQGGSDFVIIPSTHVLALA